MGPIRWPDTHTSLHRPHTKHCLNLTISLHINQNQDLLHILMNVCEYPFLHPPVNIFPRNSINHLHQPLQLQKIFTSVIQYSCAPPPPPPLLSPSYPHRHTHIQLPPWECKTLSQSMIRIRSEQENKCCFHGTKRNENSAEVARLSLPWI